MSAEAEECPQLEAVTKKRLVKTLQAGKYLACALVICKVWRLAIALYLSLVMIRVLKWSINQVTNPNPVCSHIYMATGVRSSWI
jgi:hypothetical protein